MPEPPHPSESSAPHLDDALELDRLPLAPPLRDAITRWLREPAYADVRAELSQTVRRALGVLGADPKPALAELEDAFGGQLPIGTGGRRGPCGPGPNRVNAALMRETARGLAVALREAGDAPRVAIVYDTRATSRGFALVVAAALVAEGLAVTLFDAPRPTPQLSFWLRRLGCGAGVVISASHNPPTDNGIKVYGPDGAQVLGQRDERLMRAIVAAGEGELPAIDLSAIAAGQLPAGVERIDVDAEPERGDGPYHDYVLAQGVLPGSLADAELRVVFSPLHGVGHSSVVPVLRARGIEVTLVAAQLPDEGRFATLRSANPESPEAFALARELAGTEAVDLVLATDPDADRLGALARRGESYEFIDGNRLGVLMLDHVLRSLDARRGQVPAVAEQLERGWVLTTLVSSPLLARVAAHYGVTVVDDLLVGFKHHAGAQAEGDNRPLLFACEESHGYLRGNEVRDKDGAIAALLLAECAADCKRGGADLFARLAEIWQRCGYHRERTANLYARGPQGRRAIAAVMERLRAAPPQEFAGLRVVACEDRRAPRSTGSPTRDLPGTVLVFELADGGRGCRLVFRPSGTEPKIKVYALAHGRPGLEAHAGLQEREAIDGLVDAVLRDAAALAVEIMAPLRDR